MSEAREEKKMFVHSGEFEKSRDNNRWRTRDKQVGNNEAREKRRNKRKSAKKQTEEIVVARHARAASGKKKGERRIDGIQ